MRAERWRPVPGYEGLYEVSDRGRARALRFRNRMIDKLRKKPYLLKPCLINGYHVVTLWKNRIPHPQGIHRLVLLAFVGPCPRGMQGAHLDGIKDHNYLSNLKWATPKENQGHRAVHGTKSFGELHALAKLTVADVREIKAILAARTTFRYGLTGLAKKYGVSVPTIQRIRRGTAWSHVR